MKARNRHSLKATGARIVLASSLFIFLLSPACGGDKPAPAEDEAARQARERAALELKKTYRFAIVFKGVTLYDAPARSDRKIGVLPYAQKVEVTETRDVSFKKMDERWARVRWGEREGWALSYYLAEGVAPEKEYKETRNSIVADWQGARRGHRIGYRFAADGTCDVSICPCSEEALIGAHDYWKQKKGYRWEQRGNKLIIILLYHSTGDDGADPVGDAGVGDFEEKYAAWELPPRFSFYLDVGGGLYRESLLEAAVAGEDLDRMYMLLENNRYTPEELNEGFFAGDFEGSEKVGGVPRSADQRECGEGAFCDCPALLIPMPLLAMALLNCPSQEHAARLLVEYGARPDAPVNGIPMTEFFRAAGNEAAVEILSDLTGRSAGGAASDGTVKRVVPAEGLNLRSKPSTKGAIIALIPFADEVSVIEESGAEETLVGRSGRWTKVSWNGKTGWVFGGLLR
jgi:hypothetical protein